MAATKIHVSEFLKELNYRLADYNEYRRKVDCDKMTCKDIAEKIGVTSATITNLNTDSKISLIYNVADAILDNYFPLFEQERQDANRAYPDEYRDITQTYNIVNDLYQWYGTDYRR